MNIGRMMLLPYVHQEYVPDSMILMISWRATKEYANVVKQING